jgi:hypothetical protein
MEVIMKRSTIYSDNLKMNTAPLPKTRTVKMGGMKFKSLEPPKNTYETLTFTAKMRELDK